jgi:NAD(P)-dependent dehydrogenase (short-subunit alcohol dehydrogenase family)
LFAACRKVRERNATRLSNQSLSAPRIPAGKTFAEGQRRGGVFWRHRPIPGDAGRPEEIADAIVFVASAKASFITGQVIAVNGGKTAS